MDGDKSVQIARVLQNATNHTNPFYGNDVRTAYQMIIRVLQYESQQQGFDLAAVRDVEFNEVGNVYQRLREDRWCHKEELERMLLYFLIQFPLKISGCCTGRLDSSADPAIKKVNHNAKGTVVLRL